ncbi:hypothetical protein ACIQW9_04535 [Herminiimonas sp. NPDC097707]|uniref:hypothetical protein n=1 Tax=Herminiimonas sp. NPDC097707 TaxID=3364007 RepID=UPI00383A5179
MMDIDSKIWHITMPDKNIFLELGFSLVEAERYLAESQKKIDEELKLKQRKANDNPQSSSK